MMKSSQDDEALKRMRDDPSRVLILGGGRDGTAMLETLLEEQLVEIVCLVDTDAQSPGMKLAKAKGIATFEDVEQGIVACAPCVAFNLTGNEMVEEVAANLLGVGGVIGGLEARLMWRMVTDLKKAKKDLEFQASHDVLTNLVNRRYMLAKIEKELDRCKRYGVVCSLVMLDLDHFKFINDHYGHAAGDEVLKVVTQRIANHLRGADTLARWGGEEFLVLLPHTNKQEAKVTAEKCLQVIVSQKIALGLSMSVQVSFSAGISAFDEIDPELPVEKMLGEILKLADSRLYQAKAQGRRRIVSSG